MYNEYIDNKYEVLINNICTHELKEEDLHLTNFGDWISLINIANRYLEEKDPDVYNQIFNFQ